MQNTSKVPKAFRSITQLVFCKAWLPVPSHYGVPVPLAAHCLYQEAQFAVAQGTVWAKGANEVKEQKHLAQPLNFC